MGMISLDYLESLPVRLGGVREMERGGRDADWGCSHFVGVGTSDRSWGFGCYFGRVSLVLNWNPLFAMLFIYSFSVGFDAKLLSFSFNPKGYCFSFSIYLAYLDSFAYFAYLAYLASLFSLASFISLVSLGYFVCFAYFTSLILSSFTSILLYNGYLIIFCSSWALISFTLETSIFAFWGTRPLSRSLIFTSKNFLSND